MSSFSPSMSLSATSLSSSGFADGLGRRLLAFDREEGIMLERLVLRPELAAFEPMLRESLERIGSLEDERIARPRAIERAPDGALIVASEYVPGMRLSDLLQIASDQGTAPGLDAAFGFLLDVLPAFCGLHAGARFAHGTVAPCRIVVTPAGQVVLLDALYGAPLTLLRYSRRRLWQEFGIAVPLTAGAPRLDVKTDISQAALTAMMLVLGRQIGGEEYPDGLHGLVAEVTDVAQIRGSAAFAGAITEFLGRALHLAGHEPYGSADDALIAVRELAGEIGVPVCRRALLEFVEQMAPPSGEPVVEPTAGLDVLIPGDEQQNPVIEEFTWEVVDDADPYETAAAEIAPVEETPDLDDLSLETEIDLDSLDSFDAPASGEHAGGEQWTGEHATREDAAGEQAGGELRVASVTPPSEAAPALRQRRAKRNRSSRSRKDKLRSIASAEAPLAAKPAEPVPAPPPPPPQPAPTPWLVAPARAAAFEPPVPAVARPPVYTPPAPPPLQVPSYTSPPPRVYNPPAVVLSPPPIQPAAATPWVPPAAGPTQLRPIAAAPATPAPMKLKDDPVRPRGRREPVESDIYAATPEPVVQERRRLPWRRAGLTAAVLVVGMFTGRAYLELPGADALSAESSPASTGATGPASPVSAPANTGVVEIETQPAGARVLLDGKPVGESPLTLDRVPAGRHTFTFLSASGSLKRTVRVEAGRTLKLDVPIFSGWVAIFAPFVLDVAVGRQTIGTTEEARLMLSPGRHELTLTNRALGYRSVQSVDIEPGEVRTVTIDPRGTVNLNAQPWAEVWVDGQKVGDTPLARLQLPLGTMEVIFRHPQLGERRVTVTVKGNAPAAVSVDMTQPGG